VVCVVCGMCSVSWVRALQRKEKRNVLVCDERLKLNVGLTCYCVGVSVFTNRRGTPLFRMISKGDMNELLTERLCSFMLMHLLHQFVTMMSVNRMPCLVDEAIGRLYRQQLANACANRRGVRAGTGHGLLPSLQPMDCHQ
jgi:hypothetical protein